jgi:chromosome partitioning protein
MPVVAVANRKGGSGKTTTAVHLACAMGERGRQVLLVDLDAQGQAALCLGLQPSREAEDVSDVLSGKVGFSKVIVHEARPGVDLVVANDRLTEVEPYMFGRPAWERTLKRKLDLVSDRYDWVFLDCPPSLGAFTVNALVAATHYLVTVKLDFLPMDGMDKLFSVVQRLVDESNADLKCLGVVATCWRHTKACQGHMARLAELPQARLLLPAIHLATVFDEAAAEGKTVFEYDPKCQGAAAYLAIAEELDGGSNAS